MHAGARAGFANEGQFLAISTASLQDVNKRLQQTAAAKKREAFQVTSSKCNSTDVIWAPSKQTVHRL